MPTTPPPPWPPVLARASPDNEPGATPSDLLDSVALKPRRPRIPRRRTAVARDRLARTAGMGMIAWIQEQVDPASQPGRRSLASATRSPFNVSGGRAGP